MRRAEVTFTNDDLAAKVAGKRRANGADYGAAHADVPQLLDLRALAETEPAPPAFIVPDWMPAGEVALFAGHGGTGKSAIALLLMVCIASGKHFYGMAVQRRRVLIYSTEDTKPVLHWRLQRTCAWLGVDLRELAGWLAIADATGTDPELLTDTRDGAALTHLYEWLRDQIRAVDAEVLLIDGASDAFGGNEIHRRHVRQFVRAIRRLIPPHGAALILAHVDKATAKAGDTSQGYSGSTAWSNSVRARWYLRPDDASNGLLLELQKSNLSAAGAQVAVHWNESAAVFVGELILPPTRFERAAAESDAKAAVLRLIAEADAAGDPVPAGQSGPRTAWHVLSVRESFPELMKKGRDGRKRLFAAIEELRAAGAIRVDYRLTGQRKRQEVLRAG